MFRLPAYALRLALVPRQPSRPSRTVRRSSANTSADARDGVPAQRAVTSPAMAVEPESSRTVFLPPARPVSFRASAWPRRRNPRALPAALTASLRSACFGFADRRRDRHVARHVENHVPRLRQRAAQDCRRRLRREREHAQALVIVDPAACRCSSPPRLSRPSRVAGRTAPGAAADLRDGASAKPAVTSLDTSSARCVGTARRSIAAAAPVRRLHRRRSPDPSYIANRLFHPPGGPRFSHPTHC